MKRLNNFFAIVVALIVVLILSFSFLISEFRKDQLEFESYVGKKVVVQTDTLMILDYSFLSNTYKLSNGSPIAPKLVKEKAF